MYANTLIVAFWRFSQSLVLRVLSSIILFSKFNSVKFYILGISLVANGKAPEIRPENYINVMNDFQLAFVLAFINWNMTCYELRFKYVKLKGEPAIYMSILQRLTKQSCIQSYLRHFQLYFQLLIHKWILNLHTTMWPNFQFWSSKICWQENSEIIII